ncbi:MAG: FeoB-associated Cys-rich membrane protein [Sphaerochaeta sp.]|jgi:hypothetical protein|uniref:FeoB-associated Cys-rich membrane protein n=1 Tax=uncultured Sphaerochaeta sp. TaxID=886478 RepID=UPI002A0A9F63|nr:FeoB-associated Cys-rich membrane protein [uncultured Sphaerochaeta sp.]MDC7229116.1 FeoB-associated Cys-rich membrane protein [Sphaerochaetaceae bacterium]MDD4302882.1 FeoB-associated Cys-rich membrane protein [Sphaerochaeta sp.]MDD4647532.1 FeoB-associated Cys-rich membrane protein [Sphaerochaeta sp.]MDY0243620.1 FeoB-associated Cys-rich membrane protein [Sphaerochaeta sp.]
MTTIIANVVVAALIISLVAYAIATLTKQSKEESCASCSPKKGSACKGCQFADHCNKTIH